VTSNGRAAWPTTAVVIAIAFAAVLITHAYMGSFSRFASDDYCTAGILRSHGFFGAQRYWFMTWHGRASFTLLMTLAHAIAGAAVAPYLPSVMLALWVAALTWGLWEIIRTWCGPEARFGAFVLAEIVIASTLAATPDIYQSLYWETGAVTYISPLALAPVYLGLLARVAGGRRSPDLNVLGVSGLVTFVAGGFSETYAALQLVALSLGVLASLAKPIAGRKAAPVLVAGLIGSLLSALVLTSAPGNAARVASSAARAAAAAPGTWLSLALLSVQFGLRSIASSLSAAHGVTAAAAIVLPALVAATLRPQSPATAPAISGRVLSARFLICIAAGVIVIVACFVPTAYIAAFVRGGYRPQPRLVVTAQFAFFGLVCFWSYAAGVVLRDVKAWSRPAGYAMRWAGVVAVLLLVAPLNDIRHTLMLIPSARIYAASWDVQDREIRTAEREGSRDVVVPRTAGTSRDSRGDLYFELNVVGSDPDHWVNQCAAEYYGIDAIVAK
jgi:hypothetical protein